MQSSLEGASLSAREAAALLGVKPQTLYAYASRGLVRRVGSGKRRRYLVEDLERLQARQRARSGHGPVAAAALAFGEPVLDSALTAIDERGPVYRGQPAVDLAESGVRYEAVAELLWSGRLPDAPPNWAAPARRESAPVVTSLEELAFTLPSLFRALPEPPTRSKDAETALARSLIASLARLLARDARAGELSVATRLSARARAPKAAARDALDLALVLLADHELNASSFAARIAASTDASLPACLLAAVATVSGPRHGGASDRVEALLNEAATLPKPADVIERRVKRGDALPGFGHPLYPHGDPRARPLLARAEKLAARSESEHRRLEPVLAIARMMTRQGLPPNVDFGLVALTRALGMKDGTAALLFALGRSAGWVAHVLEQRQSSVVLRPRARYTPA